MRKNKNMINFTEPKYIEFPLKDYFINGQTTQIRLDVKEQNNYFREVTLSLTARLIRDIQHSDKIELEVKTPLNWWQHLKHDHAPKWFTCKYPIKYTTVKQTFHYDLEVISFLKFDLIKNLSAHMPIIRGIVREKSDIGIYEPYSEKDFKSSRRKL